MNTRTRPPCVSLLIDERGMRCWLAEARPGDVIEYHRGVLAIDRLPGSRLAERERSELARVADLLLVLALSNRGHLVQRRHGRDDYSYVFVASTLVSSSELRR